MAAGDTKAAALTNIRWTGTMAYAAVETYEQMVAGMRRYRAAKAKGADTRLVELEIASYMGRLGHYTADGAQPLHDTIHHDGWQGANPKGYTHRPARPRPIRVAVRRRDRADVGRHPGGRARPPSRSRMHSTR